MDINVGCTEEIDKLGKSLAIDLRVTDVVTKDPRFGIWSGSSKPYQHHYGKHGLIVHTTEVIALCIHNNEILNIGLDKRQLFLGALFHDCGKMWDYKPLDENHEEWDSTDHKRKVHHISRSALVWNEASKNISESEDWKDEVLHAILAHHGQREWGSPVGPNTKLAWMLHLCDCISARMEDGAKWDQVKTK